MGISRRALEWGRWHNVGQEEGQELVCGGQEVVCGVGQEVVCGEVQEVA